MDQPNQQRKIFSSIPSGNLGAIFTFYEGKRSDGVESRGRDLQRRSTGEHRALDADDAYDLL